MKIYSSIDHLSKLAACLGMGLEESDDETGFVLYDLRDPYVILACSSDPESPFELLGVADFLQRSLEGMDPAELGNESFEQVLSAEDCGLWLVCHALAVIARAANEFLVDDPAGTGEKVLELVYKRFHELLLTICQETREELTELASST